MLFVQQDLPCCLIHKLPVVARADIGGDVVVPGVRLCEGVRAWHQSDESTRDKPAEHLSPSWGEISEDAHLIG